MHVAADFGKEEIIPILIKAGADVNAKNIDGNTPIFYGKKKEIAELLINGGANVSIRNKGKQTALEYCEDRDLIAADKVLQKQEKMLKERDFEKELELLGQTESPKQTKVPLRLPQPIATNKLFLLWLYTSQEKGRLLSRAPTFLLNL